LTQKTNFVLKKYILKPINTLDFAAGEVLLIDKPLTWTSFDVVNKIRYAIKVKKVGHAGTLDPLATGLLIVCTGKMTKQIESFMGQDKTYTGTFVLGKTTPSYDLETAFDKEFAIDHITETQIFQVAESFLGESMQVPPNFSAIKVNGKAAYKDARKQPADLAPLPPRPVRINRFEITGVRAEEVDFLITCSKGTYIRSIAHDFGHKLGAGAYLKSLRRTAIGDFSIQDAYQLNDFIEQVRQLTTPEN